MIRIIFCFLVVLIIGIYPSVCNAKEKNHQIPILVYHSISNKQSGPNPQLSVTPKKFESHIQTLVKNGLTPITSIDLNAFYEGKTDLPKYPVLITFDDGYKDNFVYAFPILQKYHVKSTIFVVTGNIGEYSPYLDWKELKEMTKTGLVDIESHTVHHRNLTRVKTSVIQHELCDSKQILESQLQKPILSFCYPYGKFNRKVEDLVQKAGYKIAFSSRQGYARTTHDRFALERIFISNKTNINYFVSRYLRGS